MKRIFTLTAIVLLTMTILAQVPQKMSYQAVIRNGSALVTSTSVPMDINIWKDAVGSGTIVYTESQSPSTNSNGVVSIEIGGGDPAAFALIDWSAGLYFIETSTNLSGVGGGTVTGSSQLLSVPYALHAKNGSTRYIGELYGGGIIVAVWKVLGVENGLIASLTDLNAAYVYSNITTLIGPTAQSAVDGQANTTAIINQAGHTTSAAALCDAYISGIYDDWYLPAAWELNLCFNAAFFVNTVLGADGFRINNSYWSSSEATGGGANAHFLIFTTGYFNYGSKGNSGTVRAVRRF